MSVKQKKRFAGGALYEINIPAMVAVSTLSQLMAIAFYCISEKADLKVKA